MSKYSLIRVNGNAFSIMGYVTKAMKKEGRSQLEIAGYRKQAMSIDYNRLLAISQSTIEKLNK